MFLLVNRVSGGLYFKIFGFILLILFSVMYGGLVMIRLKCWFFSCVKRLFLIWFKLVLCKCWLVRVIFKVVVEMLFRVICYLGCFKVRVILIILFLVLRFNILSFLFVGIEFRIYLINFLVLVFGIKMFWLIINFCLKKGVLFIMYWVGLLLVIWVIVCW